MPETLKPDLCIVGAGALGISLAIAARERGLATALVDRGMEEPGDPLQANVRYAALAASAAQVQGFRTAGRLGLENGAPKVNFKALADHLAAIGSAAAPQTSPERLAAFGVQRITGAPVLVDRQTVAVGDVLLKAGHFILATGSTPLVPDIPGLAEIAFFTPETILANGRKLSHLLVIGGGARALELAQSYRRLGSDVTLVPHGPLLDGYDAEATAILLRHLRDEGLDIREGAAIATIVPRSQGIGAIVRDGEGHQSTLDISHVLLALGQVPELDWTASDKVPLKRDPGHPDRLQRNGWGRTSQWRISAFGGAGGDEDFHQALRRGEHLLDRLTGLATGQASPRPPMLVATEPALAQTGLVPAADGLKARQAVLRANGGENEAVRAWGQAGSSAKLVVDRRGRILGGVMVGPGAGEAISSLAMAMEKGIGARELSHLPLAGTSALAMLSDIGAQFARQLPVSNWSKRRASLRRFLP